MSTVIRDIDLRPHVGRTMSGREIVLPQDQIFLNGMRIGYIGHEDGAGICLIRPADIETIKEIEQVVDAKFPKRRQGVAMATLISNETNDRET